MQQTENYKLNLIETSDPFSPNPLNENAEKTEAALAAEAAAREALDGRVQVLELHQATGGMYIGKGEAGQFIDVGFTPKVVLIHLAFNVNRFAMASSIQPAYTDSKICLEIVEGGFKTYDPMNTLGWRLNYLALT